jgi:polysaccharide biosynthesis transport protein
MEELELTDIIRIIKKRKRILISFVLVSLILTVVYLLITPPIYQATTTVLIESPPQKAMSIENILVHGAQDEQFFQTQLSLFQSRSLIKKLLVKLDLLKSEEFNPRRLVYLDSLKKWLKSTDDNDSPTDPYSPLVDDFLERLKVVPLEESKVVSIDFQGYSPQLTAKIVNTLVDFYISNQTEYKELIEADADKWFKLQGMKVSQRVEDANLEIENFIRDENLVELDDKRDFTNQQYRQTLTETTQVHSKIIKLNSLIQQIESSKSSPKELFDSIPESLKDPAIAKLRSTYMDEIIKFENISKNLKPSHPKRKQSILNIEAIEARIPEAVDRLLTSLKADLKSTKRQEQDLLLHQKKQKEDLMELDRKMIQLKQIENEAKAHKNLLDQLLTQGKELRVYSSYNSPPIRIVDRAEVPRKPVKPKKVLYLILALTFGVFGGLVLAFLVDSTDHTIISEDDIQRHLPYRLLGSIGLHAKNGALANIKETDYKFMNEFKNLRTKLLPLLAEGPTKVFLITSTFPGEGKTTVTSNLAVSLGELGKKVLVIDADLENSKIHKKFGIEATPGIVNALAKPKSAKPTPIETESPGVWVIPADKPSEDSSPAPDVLFSLSFPPLLEKLKKTFDVILIKTAPVLCGTHTRIIESFCDGILYVMSSGKSDKKEVENMIDQLASVPIELKKRRLLNGAENKIPLLPGEAKSNLKKFRIILTKVKDKKEEVYGYN